MVSTNRDPHVETVLESLKLLLKLAESDIARDIIVEQEIILPVLSYYFADHEPKLKIAWFDVIAGFSSYRKLRW